MRNGILDLQSAFDKLRSDFTAGKQGRFRRRRTGLALSGSGADYHIRSESDYLRALEYARDIDRNDLVAGQAVNRLVDEVFLDGFKLDPRTGDKALDDDLWARYDTWSRDPDQCHVAGEFDMATIARLVFRHAIVDGDHAVLPLEDGTLQMVESHRLRTPSGTTQNVVHGVLLDGQRRRKEYWFTKDDIDPVRPVRLVSEMDKRRARDADGHRQVFHFVIPKRATQTRGVTAFAPIMDALGMHDDLQFSKLVQQQVVSCIAFIRERPEDFGGTSPTGYGATSTETLKDGSTRKIEGLAPGMEIPTAPGEKVHGFSPQVPNPGFLEQAMLILTFIGINLGLPVQVLLLDPKSTNFSGWRGAMDQARLGFREFQRVIASSFLRHVYCWKLRQWAATDPALRRAAESNKLFYEHRWNAPRWPYIEPLKDAQADSHRLEKRLTSPRRLHAEHGDEFEEIADEIVEDAAYLILAAKAKAKAINDADKAGDDPVTWRDLLSLDVATKSAPAPPPQDKPGEGGAFEDENPEEENEEERDAA